MVRGVLALCALSLGLTACSLSTAVSTAAPVVGACRVLAPSDLATATNDSPVVPCTDPHTAETFAVGPTPKSLGGKAYDDPVWATFGYSTCYDAFKEFLGADDSLALRSVISWVAFRPSQKAWEAGARWYRCDAVGGTAGSPRLIDLPTTAKGLLLGVPDDRWLLCANGPTVDGSPRVPCTEPHTWRAVTTIKVGEPTDTYPGDDQVQKLTDQYCQDSVGAWLRYPVNYDYGTTWFGQQEWAGGNRRSVCWAATDR